LYFYYSRLTVETPTNAEHTA